MMGTVATISVFLSTFISSSLKHADLEQHVDILNNV